MRSNPLGGEGRFWGTMPVLSPTDRSLPQGWTLLVLSGLPFWLRRGKRRRLLGLQKRGERCHPYLLGASLERASKDWVAKLAEG